MVLTGSASTVAQVAAVITGIIVTPILVRHLGAVQYGVYATIASAVAWLGLAHIGMGPSVLNELSTVRTLTSPKRGATVISSATAIQLTIAGVLLLAIAVAGAVVPWHVVFNAPDAMRSETAAATLIMLLGFTPQLPLSLGRVAFDAHQRGYVAQGWQLVSHLLKLALIVIVVLSDGSLAFAVLALVLPSVLAQLAQYIHAFRFSYPEWRPRKDKVSFAEGRNLLNVGGDFFLVSVAGLIITGTDSLVIAHVVGPADVTPYSVTFRLSQLPIVFLLLILNAAWPAYREAATADLHWLRRTHRRLTLVGVLLPVASAAILVIGGRQIIDVWAGPDAVPSPELLGWLAAIAIAQGIIHPSERLLFGLGKVRIIAAIGLANAVINFPLSVLLAYQFGTEGVAMATVVGYVAVGIVVLVAARRRLRGLQEGTSE